VHGRVLKTLAEGERLSTVDLLVQSILYQHIFKL